MKELLNLLNLLNFKSVQEEVQITMPDDIYQKYQSVVNVIKGLLVQDVQFNGGALCFRVLGTNPLGRIELEREIHNLNLDGVDIGFQCGCNTPIITIYGDKK